MDVDIGNFSKLTILTGAGWTRNWGGRLSADVWEDLIGHPGIQNNSRLRTLLLSEPSFEAALGMVQTEDYTLSDQVTFEKALLETFIAMDREIARLHDPWINIYGVQEMLFRFCGRRGSSLNAGYMFTLNQDLWPERNLYNGHVLGALSPSLPGLRWGANQPAFTSVIGNYSESFVMQPIEEPAAYGELHERFNVIKLHGSFNWRTADARMQLVIGAGKDKQIQESPLLNWYFEIFKKVVSAGGVRLMIVGYGFGDEHINSVISDAVAMHGLQVFIWDTGVDLRTRVLAAPHGRSIWSGLLSTISRPMIEVFPTNQAESYEYRRLKDTFFRN